MIKFPCVVIVYGPDLRERESYMSCRSHFEYAVCKNEAEFSAMKDRYDGWPKAMTVFVIPIKDNADVYFYNCGSHVELEGLYSDSEDIL